MNDQYLESWSVARMDGHSAFYFKYFYSNWKLSKSFAVQWPVWLVGCLVVWSILSFLCVLLSDLCCMSVRPSVHSSFCLSVVFLCGCQLWVLLCLCLSVLFDFFLIYFMGLLYLFMFLSWLLRVWIRWQTLNYFCWNLLDCVFWLVFFFCCMNTWCVCNIVRHATQNKIMDFKYLKIFLQTNWKLRF